MIHEKPFTHNELGKLVGMVGNWIENYDDLVRNPTTGLLTSDPGLVARYTDAIQLRYKVEQHFLATADRTATCVTCRSLFIPFDIDGPCSHCTMALENGRCDYKVEDGWCVVCDQIEQLRQPAQ